MVEFAFGLHQPGLDGSGGEPASCAPGKAPDRSPARAALFVTGANWSAAIENPFRRFGSTGEGLESTLAQVRANAVSRSSARFTWPRRASSLPTAARVRSFSPTTRSSPMTKPRPRNIANDILDCVETATAKWTKQKKSEERHPGNIRYRVSRMTQRAAHDPERGGVERPGSGLHGRERRGERLPAMARQIYYQARPKIMALTDDKELQYGYFSQTLLPDYIEETRRRLECRLRRARAFRGAAHESAHRLRDDRGRQLSTRGRRSRTSLPADFADASVDVIGPSGSISAVLFCEKEGFNPLFKAVDLANRHDLMIVSTKGVSVTAARRLIDDGLRRFRPAAVRAARLRRRRVHDPRHPAARHSALPVFKHTSR